MAVLRQSLEQSTHQPDEAALRLVVAAGGTGGHVQPAVATLRALRRRAAVDAIWIGSSTGIERSAAEALAIPFARIQTGKLRRYFSLQTPLDAVRIPIGTGQAYRILRRFRPDVVLSTGGFVSVPTVVAAWALGVPVLTHEQTAVTGLATRINARFADVIALSHAASVAKLGTTRGEVIVTGNPVRDELLHGDAERARLTFGLGEDLPIIYVTGGALGAHAINEAMRHALPHMLAFAQVIHQCGPESVNGDLTRLRQAAAALPDTLRARYVLRETLRDELADVYAAATLVIGRAGAGTVSELAVLGKPSILIPLPGAGGDEQTANASTLATHHAAVLLPQSELTPERLIADVRALLSEPDRLAMMGARAREVGRPDAAEHLATAVLDLARTKGLVQRSQTTLGPQARG